MKYFAYGSNMLTHRLKQRVSSADFSEVVYLPKYQLVFDKVGSFCGTGKCGIVPSEDNSDLVYGVVFDMDEKQLPDLDYVEGLGNGYERMEVTLFSMRDDKSISAITYYPTSRDPEVVPYDWYKAIVLKGAREHQLPEAYQDFINSFGTMPDPDEDRAAQHWKIVNESVL